MKGAKARVTEYTGREDGTYSTQTGEAITYKSGYQFSFVRPEAFERLNDAAWDKLTVFLMKQTGSIEHIGVYQGAAETSFRTQSFKQSMYYAGMFNQESVLDWKAKYEGKDWRIYLIQNPDYDEQKEVDYDGIIKRIL